MKKTKILIVAVLIVGIVTGLYLRGSAEKPVEEYEFRPTVSAAVPEYGDIFLYTELTGTIEPQTKAAVIPKMGGEVLEIYVEAGDYVEAGTVLCKIDSDVLTSLKLQVDAALVTLNDCRKNLSWILVLYANGDVAAQELEQIQNAVESAQIAYEAAKDQYELHMGYTAVTAPISGTVESRTMELHEFVSSANPICMISAREQLQVNFGVTEKILSNLKTGDPVQIEKNGTGYEGIVTEISSMVNAVSGLYDVIAAVAENRELTTGTKVKLTVLVSQAKDVMTVPLDAVRYDNGNPFVYCYQDGVADKVYIDSGLYDSGRMEVCGGLDRTSRIITTWSNELTDGGQVLLKDDSEENHPITGSAVKTEQEAGDQR